MSDSPQISIILPFYNPGRYFQAALQSVVAQTFADWELLLMDDGSTDGSLEVARSLDDPRVRVFSDGQSLKLNRRLNQLIDLARAPYIARMDADDLMHPDRLRLQYATLCTLGEDAVVGAGTYIIDAENRVVGARFAPETQQQGYASTGSFIHATVMASSSWFRKHKYSEAGAFHRAEDVELWRRTAAVSAFINLPVPLYFYREYGSFSLDKYVASLSAMLVLATRERPKTKAMYLLTVCLLKMWITAIAVLAGRSGWIIARRSRSVTPEERTTAERALAEAQMSPLPLKA